MNSWVSDNSDYALFAGISILAMTAVLALLWSDRRRVRDHLPPILGLAATLLLGYGPVTGAGEEERAQIRRRLEGFAPTYAAELEALGHGQITLETAPTDGLYLKLVDAQKRWLAVNPSVADIYTMRKNANGKFAFVIDSETDYNRDGDYADEREERTAIGEASRARRRLMKCRFFWLKIVRTISAWLSTS